jgi:hypothetical protein
MRKAGRAKRTIPGQTLHKGKQATEAAPETSTIGTDLHRDLVEFDRGVPLILPEVLQSLKEGTKK